MKEFVLLPNNRFIIGAKVSHGTFFGGGNKLVANLLAVGGAISEAVKQ